MYLWRAVVSEGEILDILALIRWSDDENRSCRASSHPDRLSVYCPFTQQSTTHSISGGIPRSSRFFLDGDRDGYVDTTGMLPLPEIDPADFLPSFDGAEELCNRNLIS
jgi:hypothetical protein